MEEINTASEALVFDAAALAPVAMFMAKRDIRYYICGIHVMPHPEQGVYIVGTDGHRLAIWHDQKGQCDKPRTLTITTGLIAAAKKRTPRLFERRISYENGRLVLAEWGEAEDNTQHIVNELYVQAGKADIDGTYPDIWRVIPKEDELSPGMHGSIQPQYLKQLGDVASILPGGSKRYASPYFFTKGTDGNGAVLARYDGVQNFMVITMPLRSEWQLKAVPDAFLRPANS